MMGLGFSTACATGATSSSGTSGTSGATGDGASLAERSGARKPKTLRGRLLYKWWRGMAIVQVVENRISN